MDPQFTPGDDLIFQLESGYGLLRVLAVDGEGSATVWHLLAYEDFYPSVEAAEQALAKRFARNSQRRGRLWWSWAWKVTR